MESGLDIKDITFIDGTVYKTRKREDIYDAIELPHYEALLADKKEYANYIMEFNMADTDELKAGQRIIVPVIKYKEI